MAKNPRVVALIIARMTSSRLPGKGLRDIGGRVLLGHIVDRLRTVSDIDEIVVLSTSDPKDEPLRAFAMQENVSFYAYTGDIDDVTGRMRYGAEAFGADVVVTVSGDCPLIDPCFIQELLYALKASEADAVILSSGTVACVHEGWDVWTMDAWRKVEEASVAPHHREHPGSYFTEHQEFLETVEVELDPVFQRSDLRISVDNYADLAFQRVVHEELYDGENLVELRDVLCLLDTRPDIKMLNAHVMQKGIMDGRSRRILFGTDPRTEGGFEILRRCLILARYLNEEKHCGVSFVLHHTEQAQRLLESQGLLQEVVFLKREKADAEVLEVVRRLKIDAIVWGGAPLLCGTTSQRIFDEVPACVLDDLHDSDANASLATMILDLASGSR